MLMSYTHIALQQISIAPNKKKLHINSLLERMIPVDFLRPKSVKL